MDVGEDVGFTISTPAETVIRDGGGKLHADRTLEAELERSAPPLRPPREDPVRADRLA